MSNSLPESIRLNKFISDSGFCSRREADRFIEQGCVKLNGKTVAVGAQVFAGDEVRVNGRLIAASAADKSDRVYIAYHKPVGITCTTLQTVQGNITDAINHPERIFPIGRLDKDSEGLIFLTSDGDIVNKILRAENGHDKEYVVTVNKALTPEFIQKMSIGVPILDRVTLPCQVQMQSRFVFKIILNQGLNRQIRRMCEYFGYKVVRLVRTRIMNVSLGNLPVGHWRNLPAEVIAEINRAVSGSTKVATNVAARTSKNSAKSGKNPQATKAIKKDAPRPRTGRGNKSPVKKEAPRNKGRTSKPRR
ncbi:pseudouridine synthase [Thiosulfatimonas sediminis]|uniref:Pseudouridine synthase n=1 Tax=Thiosulfatimonas sediminis TaxID=2675054 RepID=A0A6F8PVP4_9GAMM|nr:23S rRNA pseudouridine(2604) synthase RluF [Thiosulfatimonas sediminis]BBP46201.1 pseudouridine synthase [Thiosulfatimonas sediminis]